MANKEVSLEVYKHERVRYQRKGYGLIFAILITVFYFFVFPDWLKMIYPKKIENEGVFVYWSVNLLHYFNFIFFTALMYIIYHLELPFFERYKVTNDPWPWNDPEINWPQFLKRTCIQLAINEFLCIPIMTLEPLLTNKSRYQFTYETIPDKFTTIAHIVFFMICEDFTFYWAHRALHNEKLYLYIHKIHHEYKNPVCIDHIYAHPIEFMFGNVLTTFVGPLILGKRTHVFTLMIWIIMRTGETNDGHCGYDFSFSPYRLIPLSGSAEFHHYHHKDYIGNYGSFFNIWDRVCGTVGKGYREYLEKKMEIIDKKEVKRSQ